MRQFIFLLFCLGYVATVELEGNEAEFRAQLRALRFLKRQDRTAFAQERQVLPEELSPFANSEGLVHKLPQNEAPNFQLEFTSLYPYLLGSNNYPKIDDYISEKTKGNLKSGGINYFPYPNPDPIDQYLLL